MMALAAANGRFGMSPDSSSTHAFFLPAVRNAATSQSAGEQIEKTRLQSERRSTEGENGQETGGFCAHDNVMTPHTKDLETSNKTGPSTQLTLRSSPTRPSLSGQSSIFINVSGDPAVSEPQSKRRRITPEPEKLRPTKQSTLWNRAPDETNKAGSMKESAKVVLKETSCAMPENDFKNVIIPAGPDLQSRAVTPQKKVMKLRMDGRLFSPKKDKRTEPESGTKRTKSKQSKNKYVAVYKYGSDEASRRSIGQEIDKILSGQLRIRPKSDVHQTRPAAAVTITSATPTKKAPHPFFLGKKNEQTTKSRPSSPTRVRVGTSEVFSLHKASVKNVTKPGGGVLFNSGSTKPNYPAGCKDPLWPPEGIIHSHAFTSEPIIKVAPEHGIISVMKKKSKESSVVIPPNEEAFFEIRKLVKDPTLDQIARHDTIFLAPERRIWLRVEIPPLVASQLSHQQLANLEGQGSSQDTNFLQTDSLSMTSQRLLNSLSTAVSAFDTFTCENQEWVVKYRPRSAIEVLQPRETTELLKNWLIGSIVQSTTTVGAAVTKIKRKSMKKRKKLDEFDDFIVTSEDEGIEANEARPFIQPDMEMFHFYKTTTRPEKLSQFREFTVESFRNTKAVIVCGPPGCGKTAMIHAIAQELAFEVFEINSSSRRSGRDILEKVGDMTKNHLVNKGAAQEGSSKDELQDDLSSDPGIVREEIASGKQSTMQSFFAARPVAKSTHPKPVKLLKSKVSVKAVGEEKKKPKQTQKQSLILLEDVDVLFEEDKQFWNTITTLIQESKRPIVMTCNDESLLPADGLEDCSILTMTSVSDDLAADYLLLIAAHEGHLLNRSAVTTLYKQARSDLRASIMQLNFWCQMALRDPTGGLNWMLLPQDYGGSQLEVSKRRVFSCGTIRPNMSTLAVNESSNTTIRDAGIRIWSDAVDEWDIDFEDLVPLSPTTVSETTTPVSLDELISLDLAYDSLSAWDIQSKGCHASVSKWSQGSPPISDQARGVLFTIGPPLLEDDCPNNLPNTTSMIGATINQMASSVIAMFTDNARLTFDYPTLCQSILKKKASLERHQKLVRKSTQAALEPVSENVIPCSISTFLDLAPYVRNVISYDHRLKQERNRLESLLADGAHQGKRQRTTRASRAALEGGHKSSTRREDWFEIDLDHESILETGGLGWQDIAHRSYEKAVRRWKWVRSLEQSESEDELCQ